MKRIPILLMLLALCIVTRSQDLGQVNFNSGTTIKYLSLVTDDGMLIRLDDQGKILEWGYEVKADRYEYYSPKLQPFMGRIEYYTNDVDSAFRGKIKSIGTVVFTYYGKFEDSTHVGKLKTAGRVMFDYYRKYDNLNIRGKLRMVGTRQIQYYSEFENEAYRGRIRSIGSTEITYYSSFDDKQIRGKVKNIAGVSYQWYTSTDGKGYGGLKVGAFRQNIAGVTYIIQ